MQSLIKRVLMFCKLASSLALGFFATSAHASIFMSDTSIGKSYLSQTFSVERELSGLTVEGEPKWLGNLSLGISSYRFVDSVTQESVVSRSYALSLGLSWLADEHWSFDGSLQAGSNPYDSLYSTGLDLLGEYTNKIGPEDEAGFRKNYSLGTRLTATTYSQTAIAAARRKNNETSNQIVQNSTEVHASLKPVHWMKTKVSYEQFKYNKDIEEFLTFLSYRTDFTTTGSGLLSSLLAFPKRTYGMHLYFYVNPVFDLRLSQKSSVAAFDDSISKTTTIAASREWPSDLHTEVAIDVYASTSELGESETSSALSFSFALPL